MPRRAQRPERPSNGLVAALLRLPVSAAAGEPGVARGQDNQVVHARATQAYRANVLHDQQIARSGACHARPVLQRRDDGEVRQAALALGELFALGKWTARGRPSACSTRSTAGRESAPRNRSRSAPGRAPAPSGGTVAWHSTVWAGWPAPPVPGTGPALPPLVEVRRRQPEITASLLQHPTAHTLPDLRWTDRRTGLTDRYRSGRSPSRPRPAFRIRRWLREPMSSPPLELQAGNRGNFAVAGRR